jgi:glutaredoxin-related protein
MVRTKDNTCPQLCAYELYVSKRNVELSNVRGQQNVRTLRHVLRIRRTKKRLASRFDPINQELRITVNVSKIHRRTLSEAI